MANLKTDYKDDILDSTQNTRRKFRMITNDDGTFSFEDVTDYLQYGDSFGALDLNAITNSIMNECLKRIDVVDNTESTATNLPLSANKGRELNEKMKKRDITLSFFEGYGITIISKNACYYRNGVYHIDVFLHLEQTINDGGTIFTIVNNTPIVFGRRIDCIIESVTTSEKHLITLAYNTNYFFINGKNLPAGDYKVNMTIEE